MKRIITLALLLLPLFALCQTQVQSFEVKINDTAITGWNRVRINEAGDYVVVFNDSTRVRFHLLKTSFGLMPANTTLAQKEQILKASGINLIRITLFVQQQGTHSDLADQLLKDSFQVAFNFDWANTSSPVAFSTDTALIRIKAEEFFSYYQAYKNQIPFVVNENEWNNINYHLGTIQDYLTELAIVTNVAHKYGFRIADAGISGSALQQWTYWQIQSKDWAINYKVPYNSDNYKLLLQAVDQYAAGIKNIPIDYLNAHWYEQDSCYNGFQTAVNLYKTACGKSKLISNEFGIRGVYSDKLFMNTVNEVRGNVSYGILYSGNNAINISPEQIKYYLDAGTNN